MGSDQDAKKKTTLKIACHGGAVVGSLVSNEPVHVVLNAMQMLRISLPSKLMTLVVCSLSALILGFEKRFLGTFGYLAILAGWKHLAAAMLSFHYGLMSFDAKEENVVSSASYAGLTLAYSIENFPNDKA